MKKAFTLIELLVVIAIIALLLSILLPSLKKAKGLAKRTVCLSNLGQIAAATVVYTLENDGAIPVPASGYMYNGRDVGQTWPMWTYGGNKAMKWGPGQVFPAEQRALAKYIPAEGKTYLCPGDGIQDLDGSFAFKSTIGFVDGHAAYTERIMGYVETPAYKWNP